jgi:hypothetical protein
LSAQAGASEPASGAGNRLTKPRVADVRETLGELFPTAPSSSWPLIRLIPLYAVSLAGLVLVALARQPGTPATSTLWAEDGAVFYQQALTRSFWTAVTTAYNGYVELLPRIAVEPALLFPVRDASTVIALTGDVLLGLMVLLVFHAARGHLPSLVPRCVLALSMILLPLATAELLSDVVDIGWWMLFAGFWVLLWRPQAAWERWLAAAFMFVAAMTEPITAVFLPLVLARAVALPRWRDNTASAGLVAGLLLQSVCILTAGATTNPPSSVHGVFTLFFLRVGTGSIGGVHLTNSLVLAGAQSTGVVFGIAIFAAAAVLVVWSGSRRLYLFAAFALAFAAVTFGFEIWDRGLAPEIIDATVDAGSRYAQTPQLLLLSVFIVVAAAATGTKGRRAPPLALLLVVVALVPAWLVDFHALNGRAAGPAWPAEVALATQRCATTNATSETLPITPATWKITIPCRSLQP